MGYSYNILVTNNYYLILNYCYSQQIKVLIAYHWCYLQFSRIFSVVVINNPTNHPLIPILSHVFSATIPQQIVAVQYSSSKMVPMPT